MIAVIRGFVRRGLAPAVRPLLPVIALLGLALPAAGQEPPVPPVRDTIVMDTLAAIAPEDTVAGERPVVRYPAMPMAPAAGFAAGEWVWDRQRLLRETPTSLTDLLAAIPGVTTFRAGVFAQPEAASAFGGTAARMEIELDGFVLDPVAAASFDLAQLPLAQIREVRIQRRLGLLRIRILTDYAVEAVPYTRVEAGLGQPQANLFRGVVLAPRVLIGPLGLAIERLDTDGPTGREPSSLFSGWAKWGWTNGTRGIQLELLQSTLERGQDSPWLTNRFRRDVVVRARNAFAPGLMAEVYGGRTTVSDSLFPPPGDTTSRSLDLTSTQAGGRLVYSSEPATVQARVRYRDAAFLPRIEAGLEADARLGPLRLGGEVAHATWEGADATTFFGVHAEAGIPALSVFAELTGGTRGTRPYRLEDGAPVITDRSGWRAGLSASLLGGRASGSVAAFGLTQDLAYPFGLPFDTAGSPLPVNDARGLEAMGRLVLVPGWLAVESAITEWFDAPGWAYVSPRSWRTALESHLIPLPTGNLEILGRLEAAQRSAVLAFAAASPGPDDSPVAVVPSSLRLNGYLHVRVIDVRIFVRYEDLLGNTREVIDLPGRPIAGPRIFYGVRWNLWN
jgi:hypothetical protein